MLLKVVSTLKSVQPSLLFSFKTETSQKVFIGLSLKMLLGLLLALKKTSSSKKYFIIYWLYKTNYGFFVNKFIFLDPIKHLVDEILIIIGFVEGFAVATYL